MKKINTKQILLIALLCISPVFLTACTKTSTPSGSKVSTQFPLPKDQQGLTDLGNSSITFQTSMNIKDSMEFYKTELTKMNLKERTITTSSTDTTFSIVFDGSSNGQAVVVQGVTINDKTNITIRYEKI